MYGVVLMVAMAGGRGDAGPVPQELGLLRTRSATPAAATRAAATRAAATRAAAAGHKHKWHKSKGCCGSYVLLRRLRSTLAAAATGSSAATARRAPPLGCYGALGRRLLRRSGPTARPGVIVPDAEEDARDRRARTSRSSRSRPFPERRRPASRSRSPATPACRSTAPRRSRPRRPAPSSPRSWRAGKSYSYTFKAEFVRDGKNVVVTRNVEVKAGSDITVSLESETAVASR